MRNVRIFFRKYGRMKFASHLDMNRLMSRLLRLSGIPIWYTEGFNRHPYITFALPLSLGYTSEYEIFDIKLIDDDFSDDMVFSALGRVFPEGLEVVRVAERIKKSGEIAFAEFSITFESDDTDFANSLSEFLKKESIITEKKTKKGNMKEVDLAPFIGRAEVTCGENVTLKILLTAGNENNINPSLLLSAYGETPYYTVCRTMIYDSDMECFK